MTRVFGAFELLFVGLWLGAMVFFSFVVAATAFRALDSTDASAFIRAIFPRYYLFGLFCGVGALAFGTLDRCIESEWNRRSVVSLALIGLMFLTTGYARQVLTPQIETHRDARAEATEGTAAYEAANGAFRSGHRLSVTLNLAVLLLGLFVFVARALLRRSS